MPQSITAAMSIFKDSLSAKWIVEHWKMMVTYKCPCVKIKCSPASDTQLCAEHTDLCTSCIYLFCSLILIFVIRLVFFIRGIIFLQGNVHKLRWLHTRERGWPPLTGEELHSEQIFQTEETTWSSERKSWRNQRNKLLDDWQRKASVWRRCKNKMIEYFYDGKCMSRHQLRDGFSTQVCSSPSKDLCSPFPAIIHLPSSHLPS